MENLVESIQKNLGFAPLQKIDPNTQDVKKPEEVSAENYLPQAAIPAVLLGLYKFSRTEEGNTQLLKGDLHQRLLKTIFGNKTQVVIDKVASYTGNVTEYAAAKMEIIAAEALRLVKEALSNHPTGGDLKSLFELLS